MIAVCQYFCGDNIDPAFIQARRLLNVVVHLLAVVVPSRDLILLCVLLLFPSRFSFPEQRLNGEATTRTIRRASCVIESPLPFSAALCLGFHFLFPFAIAFVIRYRSAVAKKNNDVCLVGVFSPSPPPPFSPATRMQELQLQSFVLPEWQEAFGESLENAEEREERDSGESISSPNSATICSNCLLIPVDSPGPPW